MGKFLLRRLANYIVLVGVAAALGYFLAATSLHPRANFEGRNPPPPKSSVERTLNDLNLNDKTPAPTRFARWAKGVIHGDFGRSVRGPEVWPEMKRRMGVSLRLLLIGAVLGSVLGVGVGVISAVKQYTPTDHVSTVLSFVILSIPVFLLAVLLKFGALNINQTAGRTLLYYTGEANPGVRGGWIQHAGDRFQHIIVPTMSLVIGTVAYYSRYQRNAMLDVLGSDFLRTAQAKGLRRRWALTKHGLRAALIPMATFFSYEFGLLLTGAIFTEKIFGWHGMGEWLIDSINNNDVNVVAAITLFTAVLVLLAGMLADLAYAALDPRVRIS